MSIRINRCDENITYKGTASDNEKNTSIDKQFGCSMTDEELCTTSQHQVKSLLS